METCSNCGATNRPGAKFCTSCGVRLPTLSRQTTGDWDRPSTESTTTAAATTTPEPATTTTMSMDAEPDRTATGGEAEATGASWSESAERDEATAAPPTEPEPEPETESGRASWTWGQAETPASSGVATDDTDDTGGADEPRSAGETTGEAEAPVAEGDDTEASTGGPEGDASSTLSSWAAQWTGEYAAAPEAGEEQRSATGEVPAVEDEPERDQAGDAAAADAPQDEAEPVLGAATTASATAQSGVASASGTGVEPPAVVTGQEAESAFAPSASDEQAGALQRAGDLLDELRGLLPVLSAPPAPAVVETPVSAGEGTVAVGPDTGGVADELAAARASSADTTDLRHALEAARDRQRDVDTMIDIVGRIEPMLAALDAHDRYAAAIDRAIEQLRGEDDTGATPELEQDENNSFSWQSR
jgi:hypothetical protein